MTAAPDAFADVEIDDEEPAPLAKRRRGRPPKKGGKKVTKVTRQEYIEDEEEDEDDEKSVASSPLFGDESSELGVVKVRVARTEPNEGMLGYLEDGSTASEREISERWGGGVYLCQGVNSISKIVKARTVRIAGDPIFQSTMAKLEWERRRRQMTVDAPAAAAVPAAPQMSMQDMLTFMREQETLRLSSERAHQERMRELDKADEDRRRRDEEERDRRRKVDEEERDRRRRIEHEESEKRQQTFLQQTIAMMTAANNQTLEFVKATSGAKGGGENTLMEAVKTIAVIKDAFGPQGGDSDADVDPVTMLIKEGPKWLDGLGGAIGGAIREYKGNPAPLPQAQQHAVLPAPSNIPLPPSLAPKVATLVSKIVEKGGNPEEVLAQVVDNVIAQVDKLEKIPPKPPAPGAPASPSPVQAAAPSPGAAPVHPTVAADPLSKVIRLPFDKRRVT